MRRLIMRLLKLVQMIHFSIKTPQWIKTIYSAKAKRKKLAQSITIGSTLSLYKGAVVFCSSHVSEVLSIHLTVSNRGPGGKETPPAC